MICRQSGRPTLTKFDMKELTRSPHYITG